MSARLRGKNDYPQTVRLPEAVTRIDTSDPIGAATAGQLIRNIKANNFDDVANLLVVASSCEVIDGNRLSVQTVIRTDTITIMTDANGNTHRLKDPAMVKNYIDAGMTITGTEDVDIMG